MTRVTMGGKGEAWCPHWPQYFGLDSQAHPMPVGSILCHENAPSPPSYMQTSVSGSSLGTVSQNIPEVL